MGQQGSLRMGQVDFSKTKTLQTNDEVLKSASFRWGFLFKQTLPAFWLHGWQTLVKQMQACLLAAEVAVPGVVPLNAPCQ